MKNNKLIESLNRIGIFIGGGLGYHLIDRALMYPETKQEEATQLIRDQKMDEAIKEAKTFYSYAEDQFKLIKDAVKQTSQNTGINYGENRVVIPKEEWVKTANTIKENSNSVISKLSELNIPNWVNSDAYENLRSISEEIDRFTNILINEGNTNNFVSNFSKLYEYLDTLTLLQESSLFHIILFLILSLTVTNILAVLFGHEMIKYLNLESRFPRLGIFFKLRAKLQRYYLMWNVFILYIVCIAGIGIDLLLFTVK